MSLSSLFWRLGDPLLMKLRSRLEHLDDRSPSESRVQRLSGLASLGTGVKILESGNLANSGSPDQLVIDRFCHIAGEISVFTKAARFRMGHHSFVGQGSRVWTSESVSIGSHVLIAHHVDILDNNSHSLDYRDRRKDTVDVFEKGLSTDFAKVPSAPIVIEDDVWIGARSIILKGVHIGRGAVVAAGTVVTHDVAPFTLVAGNPARLIRELPHHEPEAEA